MDVPEIKIEVCECSPEEDVEEQNLDEKDSRKKFKCPHKQHGMSDFNGNTAARKPALQKEETRTQTPNYRENSKQQRPSPERVNITARTVKMGVKPSTADSPKRRPHGQQIMKTAEESKTSNSKGPYRKVALPRIAWNKKESLPNLTPRQAGNNGHIAALVSPILLRKYTNNSTPVDISPLKGWRNSSEITSQSQNRSQKLPDPEALFRNSTRSRARLSLEIPNLKVRSSSQERGRSNSMGNVHNFEEEKHFHAAKTSCEPSKHWRKARQYTLAKESRLPEIVRLYSQLDGMHLKMSADDSREELAIGEEKAEQKSYISMQENDTKKKLNKKKTKTVKKSTSEGILSSSGENCEAQFLKDDRIVSLKERLEAIEQKHGIVHQSHRESKDL